MVRAQRRKTFETILARDLFQWILGCYISGYMGQLDITLLIVISQEVEPHIYMLGARV